MIPYAPGSLTTSYHQRLRTDWCLRTCGWSTSYSHLPEAPAIWRQLRWTLNPTYSHLWYVYWLVVKTPSCKHIHWRNTPEHPQHMSKCEELHANPLLMITFGRSKNTKIMNINDLGYLNVLGNRNTPVGVENSCEIELWKIFGVKLSAFSSLRAAIIGYPCWTIDLFHLPCLCPNVDVNMS